MTRRLVGAVADSGPVLVLAGIAAAGSFTHIRDTASEHGQGGWMAWAIAVCIDLTCVMAARERQRDKRTERDTGRLSWPTLVLVGGILLSLAANLAQADPTAWGWITAGTPAAAFLVAVSMLERRATGQPPADFSESTVTAAAVPAPSSAAHVASASSSSGILPGSSSPWVVWDEQTGPTPAASAVQDERDGDQDEQDGQTSIPVSAVPAAASVAPGSSDPSSPSGSSAGGPLADFARRVATEHHTRHGRPITRDALRARLGVSNQLASDLLRQIRTETA